MTTVAYTDDALPDGLDSSRVEPFGRFRVRPTEAPPVPWAGPPAPAAADDDWVLGCIQQAFETPAHVSQAWDREPVLAAPPRRLALPPAPVPRPASAPAPTPAPQHELLDERLVRADGLAARFTPAVPMPAALAAAPRPLPLLDLGRVIDVDALNRVDDDGVNDDGDHDITPRRRRSVSWAHQLKSVCKVTVNVAILMMTATLLLSNGALGLLPFRGSYVLTGSMSPGMPVGALVISKQVPATDVHKGDVITFAHPTKPGVNETHRVNQVMLTDKGEVFITKGDANGAPDPWRIPRTGKIWKRVASFKRLGYPLGWLQQPKTHLAVTLLPAFALAAWILCWVWKPVLAAKKVATRH